MIRSEIEDLVEELQSVSLDMDPEQIANTHTLCAVLEDITAESCRQVIRAAGKGPVLQVFMSDGWSCDMRARVSTTHGDARVDRVGRMRTEFVMQRAIIKCRRGDHWHMAVKVQRPRPLASKKCGDLWAAACDFVAVLPLSGHEGVSIHVYLQDGLFIKPFGRLMIARHLLFWQKPYCPLSFDCDEDRQLAEMRDWVFCSRCLAHSCSLAIKWGMRTFLQGGDELLESIHISVSALLRASTGLYMVVPEFIATYVVFDLPDLEDPQTRQDTQWLWYCLEVPPNLMDIFLKVNPRWYGDRLHCSAVLAKDPAMMSCLKTVIHCCLRWVDFSETRWTKVGLCSRYFTRSLLIGIDKLVPLAMKHDGVCKWHLGGFNKKCSASVRQYLAIAALSARPSEAMLFELMQDDRFLLNHGRCWQALRDEHQYIEAAPDSFFATVSAILNVDCSWYKTSVLESSLTSVSYLHMDCFGPLTEAPLKYVVGNLDDNIRSLMNEEGVVHPLAVKWKTLVSLGFEEEVLAGLALFREAAFSTILVEQAHASGSQVMRRHPMLETHSLVVRMTLHNCRMLFCHCPLERQFSHLESLLDKVDKQFAGVHHTGARQMYVKALCEEVNAQKVRGSPSGKSVRLSIFKHHSQPFSKLNQGQMLALTQRAAAFNTKKIETLEGSRRHIVDQMQLLKERQAEEKKSGLTNHMQSCRFTPELFERFAELWPQYTAAEDRSRTLAPPKGIPPLMDKLLNEMMTKVTVSKAVAPDWLVHLVDNRDAFAGVGLYADSAHRSGDVIFKLSLSIAQPRRVVFLECHRSRRGLDRFDYAYGRYEYEAFRFVTDTLVPWKGSSDIWVIPSVAVSGAQVRTAGEPVPWSVFTRYLKKPAAPAKHKEGGTALSRNEAEILRLLQLEYPWLSEEELRDMLQMYGRNSPQTLALVPGARPLPSGASSSSSGGQEQQQPQPEALPEDVVAQVALNLEAIRAEVAASNAGGDASFFKMRVLGGPWSVALKKTLTTDFGSYAKDKSIALWCQKVQFPERKSFSVNRYGFSNARVLAEEVVRRGDYFLGGWVDAGSPVPFDFTALAVAYEPIDEFVQWFDDLPLDSWSSKAAFGLSDLTPMPVREEVDVPWRSTQ